MKKTLIVFAAMVAIASTLQACEKYEDGKPLKNVRQEFNEMYPDARDVEWEMEFGNWVVSFETGTRQDVREHEAWYDVNANWLRTETDIPVSDLPEALLKAIEASEYAAPYLVIDDVDYVETPDGALYQVDVRVAGVEVALDVKEDGTISLSSLGR